MTDDAQAKRQRRRQVNRWYAELAEGLPDNFTPLNAVITMEALDDEGSVCLFTHKSSDLPAWRAYGMLAYALDDFSSATINATHEDDE